MQADRSSDPQLVFECVLKGLYSWTRRESERAWQVLAMPAVLTAIPVCHNKPAASK